MHTTLACIVLVALATESATAFHCPVPNGFFPAPNPHHFLRCVDGVDYEYVCPEQLVWNYSKGQCDWTSGPAVPPGPVAPVHPEVTVPREAHLVCPRPDGFFVHPNPHKFFRCVNGVDYEYVCPEKLVWNQARGQCDWTSDRPQTPEHHEPAPAGFVCPRPTGYFAQPGNAHQFIQCLHGRPFLLSCPGALVWNSHREACDYSTTN